MSDELVVAVNGRFLTQDVTGTQRYAHELVSRLGDRGGLRILLLAPPQEILELTPGTRTPDRRDPRWSGMAGHRWEQSTLRRLFRRSGAGTLLNLCGWGPVGLRDQVVVIHDIHALLHPEFFAASYGRWCRVMMPLLVRGAGPVVAANDTARRQLIQHLKVDPGRIHVVPSGVGPPFTERNLGDLEGRPRRYCLFVGGDKAQKNLAFLSSFWPQVHRELGLELWVTERHVQCRTMSDVEQVPGIVRMLNPSDVELMEAYAGALCLLWPSIAEGYGIPLLEAMAVGTPFLASDVGSARELAVTSEQVLPLEPERWISQLREWQADDPVGLRQKGAERAREVTWDRGAETLAAMLLPLLRSGTRPQRSAST